MKRFIFDTNIYGELIFDRDFLRLKEAVKKNAVIHGFTIIRNELRDVPKQIKLEGKNLRIGLLHIYDELTSKSYSLTSEIEKLGNDYYTAYRSFGGSKALREILNDFLIVACASQYSINIIVSEDNKTMLTENARKAYNTVNGLSNRKTPQFFGYLELKRWLIE